MRRNNRARSPVQERNNEITLEHYKAFEEVVGRFKPPNLTGTDRLTFGISVGSGVSSSQWRQVERTSDDMLRWAFAHDVGPKEGTAWTPAVFKDEKRRAECALHVAVVVFDCDRGQPFDEIASRIREAGYAAILVTTHSHGRTETQFGRREWERWRLTNLNGDPARFMRERGYDPTVANTATLRADDPEEDFITIVHPPCDKVRVILFAKEPWKRTHYANTRVGAQAYSTGLKRVASELGIEIDPAATDVARLFFDPRHPKGSKPRGLAIPGELVDAWPIPHSPDDDGFDLLTPDDLRRMQKTGLSRETFASAVRATPNDERFDDRNAYVKVGASIFHESDGGEWGLELFQEWCARWPGGNDPEENERVWRSFEGASLTATGRTILKYARDAGWTPPGASIDDPQAPHGDLWNAARFAERHRGQLLYVAATRQWSEWNGSVWKAVPIERITSLAKERSGSLLAERDREFRDNPQDSVAATLRKAATAVHKSIDRIDKMVKAARSETGMWLTDPSLFDADPDVIGLPNGVLDLRTFEHRKAKPEDYISKLAGAGFDPTARAPQFDKFLRRVLPNAEERRVLQALSGYSLTGLVDSEVWVFISGTGRNGKSVFANILAALLGDYAVTLGVAVVTRNKHENEAERHKARLPGSRVALVNETASGDVWDDQRMKELASRERMSARLLHREAFDFMPQHKLWVRGNHMPGVLDASDGFWRRIVPIHFGVQIPEEEVVLDLDRRIIANELSGVLNWALEGLRDWRENGLAIPSSIERVRNSYREETDILGEWIEGHCERSIDAFAFTADLYRNYRAFCTDCGHARPEVQNMFARRLGERGFTRGQRGTLRGWYGLKVRQPKPENPADAFEDVR